VNHRAKKTLALIVSKINVCAISESRFIAPVARGAFSGTDRRLIHILRIEVPVDEAGRSSPANAAGRACASVIGGGCRSSVCQTGLTIEQY
jgi:hypothetical protein